MNRMIEMMKRGARVAAMAAFAATLIPSTAGARTAEPPIDLAAALFMPADAAAIGFDDYGIDIGYLYTLEQLMRQADIDSELTDHELDLYGVEAITDVNLDPVGADLSPGVPMTSFYSVLTSYTDENFAEVDFESIREDYETDEAYDVLDDHPGIGNDSLMVSEEYESEGDDVTIVTIAFLIDNVEAEVSVLGYNEDVDPDVVIEAATVVEGKLTSLLEDGEVDGEPVPGLTFNTLRYEGDELYPGRGEYVVYGGEASVYAYDLQTTELYQKRADDYGMLTQYSSSEEFKLGDELLESDPLLRARVTEFEHADDAEQFVFDREDDLAETGNVEHVEVLELPEDAYTDGAVVAVTYDNRTQTDGEMRTVYATRLFVQDGRYVYDFTLFGYESAPVDVLLPMLDDMIDCGQNSCVSPLKPPAELADWFEAQRELWLNDQK